MSLVRLACIVEGDGEVEALPVLVRRLAVLPDPLIGVDVARPIRVKRDRFVRGRDVEKHVRVARGDRRGGVLVLLDADQDCPAELGPALAKSVAAMLPDVPHAIALAKCEFETWFLAAASSLAGRCGLPDDLACHEAPESVRDAKGWLARQMPQGAAYKERQHQPRLASAFDVAMACERSPSFRRFCRKTLELMIRLSDDDHTLPAFVQD